MSTRDPNGSLHFTVVLSIDLLPSCVSIDISRFIRKPSVPKVRDPVDVTVQRFCRMMDLNPKKDDENIPNELDSINRTNVAKELKANGVTKNIELQQTLPNPSEKTRTKLRKVSIYIHRYTIPNIFHSAMMRFETRMRPAVW